MGSVFESRHTVLPKAKSSKAARAVPAEVLGLKADQDAGCSNLEDVADAVDDTARLPFAAYLAVLLLRQVVGPIFSALVACGLLRTLCGVQDRTMLMVAMLQ